MQNEANAFNSKDIEYLRHGDRAMTMRLTRPSGKGPYPVVVDLHGGAWTKGNLSECAARGEALARAGIASAALDFRHAEDGYPSSLLDINYCVRWLKANSDSLSLDADRIGLSGQSSGGHLAMLAAMRPNKTPYGTLTGVDAKLDASVSCVSMTWPVINPLSRYRHALRLRAADNPPAWTADIPERHDLYWKSEANMAEGNPMLALERGESVQTPPAIWVQGRPDPIHDYRDPQSPVALNEPERFVQAYRKAGGRIDLVYIENAERNTTSLAPVVRFFSTALA